MPLHERVIRNDLFLPGIMLCNRILADAPKEGDLVGLSASQTRLPNLQATHSPIENSLNDDAELKSKRKAGSSKQRQEDLKKSLEFVNIVDNPPTELKFLSKTDVRGTQQAGQDICHRWLERIARSMHDQIKEKEAPLSLSREQEHMQHRNSEENIDFDGDQTILELMSITSADMSMAKSGSEELLLKPKISAIKHSKDLLQTPKSPRKPCTGTFLSQGLAKIAVESFDSRAETLNKNSSYVKSEEGSCFDFVARRIDLVKRLDVTHKTDRRSAQSRVSCEYDITVNLLKGKCCNGLHCEHANQGKDAKKGKVCGRFEKRFKSAPKERISASNEDILQANKIRMYPFYETKWSKEETSNEGVKHVNKSAEKLDLCRQLKCESKKAVVREEWTSSNDVNANLKVSSLQLTTKQRIFENAETTRKPENQEIKAVDSEIKVMKISCPQSNSQEPVETEAGDLLRCGLDLYNLLTMNSVSLRETMILLARVTASSQLLSNEQILRLMKNGDINIGKFLIIRKLLLAIHPFNSKSVTGSFVVRPRKEILSLLTAVLEFIDRCEKILKQEKKSSLPQQLAEFDAGVDCIERGMVVGKMPSLSVTGYNHGCKTNQTVVNDDTSLKDKKKRLLLRSKKLSIKRENTEEHLERKAISIASLRRSILVNAMDLATNNGWRRSYLLRKRYLPKKKKIKSLCLAGFKHVNTFTVRKNPQRAQNGENHPLKNTPPSRNSVSTSFESDELRDFHVPKEQSVLQELQANEDWMEEHSQEGTKYDQNAMGAENETQENLLKNQRPRSRGTKVCEFLKGRISLKLQKNFDLYPKIQRLMSSLHNKTENKDDIKASKDSRTDFKSHFKLIDPNRYEMYCKAFAKMDKDDGGWISPEMAKMSLRFVDSVASCPAKYIEYALTVLDVITMPKITLKMFCVICGVLEKMLEGGVIISDAVGALNLMMSEGKIFWYKSMFYDSSELDANFVNLETVKLELFAGGMGKDEEQQISEKIVDKESNKISYLDFVAYIPLFIAIHDKICANAFE